MSEHETYHAADAHDGTVWVGCSCGWKDTVNVSGDVSWIEAMRAIYAARDAHYDPDFKGDVSAELAKEADDES